MIISTLNEKSVLKEKVYDNTLNSFLIAKDILKNLAKDINSSLTGIDPRIKLEYTDRSNFDAQMKVAGDIVFFSMHSNIFQFTGNIRPGKQPTYKKTNTMPIQVSLISITSFLIPLSIPVWMTWDI
jgi:hypothetical protein